MSKFMSLFNSPMFRYTCKTIIPITTISSLGYTLRNKYSRKQTTKLISKNTLISSIGTFYLLNPQYILPTAGVIVGVPLIIMSSGGIALMMTTPFGLGLIPFSIGVLLLAIENSKTL